MYMNKTLFVISILLCATLTTIVVGEEEYPILDKQVEIRQAHLSWKLTVHEIRMNGCIDYINDISNGTGSTQLSSILQNYQNEKDLISTLTTHVGLNNAIRQIISITTSFRLELKEQMLSFSGKLLPLLSAIDNAVNGNQSTIDSLEDQYWSTKKTNELEIFDIRINNAQTILDKLVEHGYDITDAQAKLDEINSKRAELEAALDQKDHSQIRSVHLELYSLSLELRGIVRDLQIDIPLSLRARFWIRVGERVVDRSSIIITELDKLEIDTIQLKQIHSYAQTNLSLAQEKYESGDINGSVDALHDLKANLIDLKDAYIELIFGGELSGTIETAVELTSDALESTIEEMDKTI